MAIAVGPVEGASVHDFRPDSSEVRRDERADGTRLYSRCPTDCTGCAARIRASEAPVPSERPLHGGSLIIASLCCFLIPLAAALVGALVAGEGAVRQLVGAASGLLSVTALTAWIAGGRRRREAP